MLPRVARSGTERCWYPSPKYSTKASTTFFDRSSSVTVSTMSVGVTPSRSCPDYLDPYHPGYRHVVGLAEHHGLRLYPSHAPAEHAQTVDHRGVRVGPDERVRDRQSRPPCSFSATTVERYSRLTW